MQRQPPRLSDEAKRGVQPLERRKLHHLQRSEGTTQLLRRRGLLNVHHSLLQSLGLAVPSQLPQRISLTHQRIFQRRTIDSFHLLHDSCRPRPRGKRCPIFRCSCWQSCIPGLTPRATNANSEHASGTKSKSIPRVSLQIKSCRPKQWNQLTTVSHDGQLYELVSEQKAPAPRRYVYLFRKKPPTAVIRGIHAYDPTMHCRRNSAAVSGAVKVAVVWRRSRAAIYNLESKI
jgi:hypothetical protein